MSARNSDGITPLFLAVDCKSPIELVAYLMDHGASPNARALDGSTPLHWVALFDFELSLMVAALSGSHDTVDKAAESISCSIKYRKKALLLIEHGADVNAKDNSGRTPLCEAVSAGKENLVQFFLEHGADVNAKDNHGKTALTIAIENKDIDMVELLKKHGARK